MFDILSMIFWAMVLIVILVGVHEFGHFWVARKLGVKVLRFSIGFGAPLWKHTAKDGVEYVFAAIPLGGYVKMVDEREEEDVAEEDLPYAFNRKSLVVRSAVVAAGPLFNLLFAIVAYWAVFVNGEIDIKSYVGELAGDSIAAVAGVRENDRIVSINGDATPGWNRVNQALIEAAMREQPAQLILEREHEVERGVVLTNAMLSPLREGQASLQKIGLAPRFPTLPAIIGAISSGKAGERAQLKPGDRILSANAQEIAAWKAWSDVIRAHPEQEIQLVVERGAEQIQLTLRPDAKDEDGKVIGFAGVGSAIPDGFMDEFRVLDRYGVLEAWPRALHETWRMTKLTLSGIWSMITGRMSVHNMGGPLTIAKIAGDSAGGGFSFFVGLLAMLSITLGVINLLPVPVLDGGHLFLFLIEAVKGSPLSEPVMLQLQKVGLIIIAAIMFLAIYVDLHRFFGM
ncbi:MAG TPA: RIP metalloprotease RseP [Gammaproteobacteria bacterium]|nr:RIP metalloprotease RseP [Gammaproteobacteria bacterium]